MQVQLKAPHIWLATEAVDFRKSINGLQVLVEGTFDKKLGNAIYIFFNRARNRLKILAYHRNGSMLIYKVLDKNKFTIKEDTLDVDIYELNEQQLSWLLAGLDWIEMSKFEEINYSDCF